jgi:hypothetical protein
MIDTNASMQRWPPAQAAERIEHKHRDVSIEGRAVVGHAVVLAVHGAGGGAQAAAAGDELRGDIAGVGDGDGVGKAKHAHAGRRLLRQVLRADGDGELRAGHTQMLPLSLRRQSAESFRLLGWRFSMANLSKAAVR